MFSFFLMRMYETILRIAHDIILIGWALLIILGVVLLCMMIGVVARVNAVVSKGMRTVSLISEYVILPFTYLAWIFARQPDATEETPKKKPAARKKTV